MQRWVFRWRSCRPSSGTSTSPSDETTLQPRMDKGFCSIECGSWVTGQRVPLLEGPWRETAKRADGPLPGLLGGMHRLDQEIVGVGFPLGNFGRFSDVHRTLYTLYSQAKSREEFIIFITIYKAKALHGKSSTYKTYGPLWSQNRVSSAEVGLKGQSFCCIHM